MNINYNFVSLIDFLALVQGILLGIVLIAGNRKNRPSLFLGLFLLTYTLELLDAILGNTGIDEQYPNLLFLPINFFFLSVPLFYFYVKNLVLPVSLKKDFWMFLPGILEFLVFATLFFCPSLLNKASSITKMLE